MQTSTLALHTLDWNHEGFFCLSPSSTPLGAQYCLLVDFLSSALDRILHIVGAKEMFIERMNNIALLYCLCAIPSFPTLH